MDQSTRNKLRNVVTQCRKLLEEAVAQELQGRFGISAHAKKQEVKIEDDARMGHLSEEEKSARQDILDHFEHIKARGFKPKDALEQLIREIAFTHLNRLCAYKMMEAREVYVGGHKLREAVSRGVNSNGFKFYLADHPDDERLFNTGQQDIAYRHFLDWLGGLLSEEIGVLFNPTDPANSLYPPQRILGQIIGLLNGEDIKPEETELRESWPKIWTEDEAIGWVYQYFTPKELRDQARKESSAPRNSYELAFRNQFFTPRYVVEFLTDNTLGRIWYEMRKGDTKLKDQCLYMVRRPSEVFLEEGYEPPETCQTQEGLSQEELLNQPAHILHWPKKDPRELKILDPACGSGHFLLYCFDLLLTIYEEAYNDPDLGPALQQNYVTLDDLRRDMPRLILANNLHGVDIDLRCTQIAALALWLRCQRAYNEMGLEAVRPRITRSNLVCAEPMPGEVALLEDFLKTLHDDRLPKLIRRVMDVPEAKPVRATPEMADRLCELVRLVWNQMKLAGEAGTLLRIEQELQVAIRKGQEEWEEDQPLFRVTQYALTEEPREKFTRIVPDEGVSFWERAEALVMAALDDFAEYTANGRGLLRKLFVNDAMRGFAFVDVCRLRFDVVLMNPPFGLIMRRHHEWLKRSYADAYVDVYASFLSRGLELCHGRLGAITSRSILMTKKLLRIRRKDIVPRIEAMLDLGAPVMDSAMVQSCAYTLLASDERRPDLFFSSDRRSLEDKSDGIHQPLSLCGKDFLVSNRSIVDLPHSKLLYSLPPKIRIMMQSAEHTGENAFIVRLGMKSFNDFRFLRLRWEIDPQRIGKDSEWEPLSKGGPYAVFYSDLPLLIRWNRTGNEIAEENMRANGQTAQARQASVYYRKAGGTYSRRCKDFGVRVLPAGCIIGEKGPAIFGKGELSDLFVIGFLNSRLMNALIHVQANAKQFDSGIVESLPWKALDLQTVNRVESLTRGCVEAGRRLAIRRETESLFVSIPTGVSVTDVHQTWTRELESNHEGTVRAINEISERIDVVFGVDSSELKSLVGEDDGEDEGANDEDNSESATLFEVALSIRDTVDAILSYSVGCAFGRWDVRLTKANHQDSVLPNPFSPIPICPPGMLQGPDGLPAKQEGVPENYPLRIDWDGILIDDAGNQDDVLRRVRNVVEVTWEDGAEAIEKDACEILGVKSLRDYFRKPGKGGFWDDHVKRYSKSRRKAPIYWLLQSSKKNYALWLYYHRLDKDMLFKALVNYVEPKINREENRLAELRSQAQGGGSKKLDRETEKQEDLLSELRDFEEKLRKVANLHLDPDLNDGVVLNIAPLHELVPWNEAKKYWDELIEGKYEWSSIGKQLREKGLVKEG